MGRPRYAKRRRLNVEGVEEDENSESGGGEVGTNPAVPKALSIDLILIGVFENLSTPELLVCSAVNKVWNFNARTILREKRMCCAKISGRKPCKDLARLDKLLGKSVSNLPFHGLSISTDSDTADVVTLSRASIANSHQAHKCLKCSREDALAECYPNILKKYTLKTLKIFWTNESYCPAVRLLKKLFREKVEALERLEILEFPLRTSNLRQVFCIKGGKVGEEDDPYWLPALKILNLSTVVTSRFFVDSFKNIVKELVLAAPQLQDLYGITPNLLEVLFYTNKIHTVRDFRCWPNCVNEKLCLHFALERPQLKKLSISPFGERPSRPTEIFTETFKLLLKSCAETLTELDIEIPYFMLMCDWDLAIVFPRLRKLRLGYVVIRNDPNAAVVSSSSRSQDFRKIFPNLTSVEIHPCSTLPRELLNNMNDEEFRMKLKQYSFEGVTTLWILSFPQMSQELFSSFAHMFPNVKHFTMNPCANLPRYMKVIWDVWDSHLESLTFTGVECRFLAGQHYLLDAVLCGISVEEVAELQGMNPDFLKTLQYVPEQSSLLSLERLKTIRIEVLQRRGWKRTESPSQVKLLYVTHNLLFARHQSLDLEFSVKDCKTADPLGLPYCYNLSLQHMRPRVKFVDSKKWNLEC